MAELHDGVIINADASQLYADLRVLSARPSVADEACVPHRLYGQIDGAEACSAAAWAELAKAEIAACHASGRLPMVVGGSGLYLRTLLDGIAPVPEIDPAVRTAVRRLDAATAYAALAAEDPALAARLAHGDRQRVMRGLEVIRSTGRSLLGWQRELTGGIGRAVTLDARVIDLPRAELHERIDARLAAMHEAALPEVAALLARRLDPALPVMTALGVAQFAAQLAGTRTPAAALAEAQAATRRYAKRQQTWFRNQTPGWMRVGIE